MCSCTFGQDLIHLKVYCGVDSEASSLFPPRYMDSHSAIHPRLFGAARLLPPGLLEYKESNTTCLIPKLWGICSGGPIKESKVGMAHVQRAIGRKAPQFAKEEVEGVEVSGSDVQHYEERNQVGKGGTAPQNQQC